MPTETEQINVKVAKMEVQMDNLQNGMDIMNKSIDNLHGKFDTLTQMIVKNYVPTSTFEEYKKSEGLKKWNYIVISVTLTGLVSLLVGLILRANHI